MKFVISLAFIIYTILPIYSYQWPSNSDYLKALFGSPAGLTVSDGIRFSSEGQAIYPLTDGEIIFYQDGFSFGDLTYKGDEGNVLVLKHLGEFKSIYRNFGVTDNFSYMVEIGKKEMIGVSAGKYDDFIFSVYDDKRNAYINPQQILPFLGDNRVPVINGVYIKSGSNSIKLYRNIRLQPGVATIYIDGWDIVRIREKYKMFTPFSVNVFVDGFERYNVSFSSLVEVDEKIFMSGENGIELGDFLSGGDMLLGGEVYLTTGSSLIEVVVKDIEGNEASKSYPVIVD